MVLLAPKWTFFRILLEDPEIDKFSILFHRVEQAIFRILLYVCIHWALGTYVGDKQMFAIFIPSIDY